MMLDSSEENNIHSITVNQFTVSVVVEDKEVPLYGIERSDDGKTVNCWVESESGKSFGVQWRDSQRTCATSGNLFVDGMPCGGRVNSAGGVKTKPSRIDYCNSGSTRRKLMFSDIETTDDDAYYGQALSEEFGSMKLLIRRVEETGKAASNSSSEMHALEKVHEKSKKVLRHQVKFGEEVPAGRNPVNVKYIEVLATFIIKYRPKDYLQANEIMPRPKKRKADPDEIIDLTLDDADESEEDDDDRIRELQAEIQAIQQKKQKSNKRVKREVKQEILTL